MGIMLGNLTVDEIEKRSGVNFSDELKTLLNETHQSNASNIAAGKWHCFDIPFVMVCGGMELAQKVYDNLKDQANDFHKPLQIALSNES